MYLNIFKTVFIRNYNIIGISVSKIKYELSYLEAESDFIMDVYDRTDFFQQG